MLCSTYRYTGNDQHIFRPSSKAQSANEGHDAFIHDLRRAVGLPIGISDRFRRNIELLYGQLLGGITGFPNFPVSQKHEDIAPEAPS